MKAHVVFMKSNSLQLKTLVVWSKLERNWRLKLLVNSHNNQPGKKNSKPMTQNRVRFKLVSPRKHAHWQVCAPSPKTWGECFQTGKPEEACPLAGMQGMPRHQRHGGNGFQITKSKDACSPLWEFPVVSHARGLQMEGIFFQISKSEDA